MHHKGLGRDVLTGETHCGLLADAAKQPRQQRRRAGRGQLAGRLISKLEGLPADERKWSATSVVQAREQHARAAHVAGGQEALCTACNRVDHGKRSRAGARAHRRSFGEAWIGAAMWQGMMRWKSQELAMSSIQSATASGTCCGNHTSWLWTGWLPAVRIGSCMDLPPAPQPPLAPGTIRYWQSVSILRCS